MILRALLVVAIAALALACTPSTATPPSPDASASAAACDKLDKAGCALGRDPLCPSRVELAIWENHTTREKVACIAGAAPTKDAIAACRSPYFACGP